MTARTVLLIPFDPDVKEHRVDELTRALRNMLPIETTPILIPGGRGNITAVTLPDPMPDAMILQPLPGE